MIDLSMIFYFNNFVGIPPYKPGSFISSTTVAPAPIIVLSTTFYIE